MTPFLQGLLLGFSIAAPVGPIGLLCLQRSLRSGRMAGFVSGLGAATADAVYGTVAAAGLSAVTHALVGNVTWLRLGGGLFLLYLGVATWRTPTPSAAVRVNEDSRLFGAYASTFFLTLTNPLTILSFVGVFAGVGLASGAGGVGPAALLVTGVFTGSAAWWLLLSSAAGSMGTRLQAGGLRVVNRVAGAALAGFGAWQLARLAS